MSVPNTMMVGPFNATVLVRKRYILCYVINIWLSLLPIFLEFWLYWQLLWDYIRPLHFYIYLPLVVFGMYITIVFAAMGIAKLQLSIVNKLHPPREGVFLREESDKDYRYWSLRNTIKRWPFWISHKFPFPFMDNLCFKVFNVKTKIQNSLFEGWVDTEFVEFGDNVVVGQAALVQSSVIIGNLLIIKKTVINDNVRIGAHAIVMPGTIIGKNSILNTFTSTIIGQELEGGWIYNGSPAKKFKRNWFFEDGLEDKIKPVATETDIDKLRQEYDDQYVQRKSKEVSRKERIETKRKIKVREKERLKEGESKE